MARECVLVSFIICLFKSLVWGAGDAVKFNEKQKAVG